MHIPFHGMEQANEDRDGGCGWLFRDGFCYGLLLVATYDEDRLFSRTKYLTMFDDRTYLCLRAHEVKLSEIWNSQPLLPLCSLAPAYQCLTFPASNLVSPSMPTQRHAMALVRLLSPSGLSRAPRATAGRPPPTSVKKRGHL